MTIHWQIWSDYANISGIKNATADLARPTILHNMLGNTFTQLSGEDATRYHILPLVGMAVFQ